MKAANFLNMVLSTALLLLCAKIHFLQAAPAAPSVVPEPAPAASASAAPAASAATADASGISGVFDSDGLAPGVRGFGGPVPVRVEVTNGAVAAVSPKTPNDETPMFFAKLEEVGLWKSWDGLPVEVAATTHVDAVTSATYSSSAAIQNVQAALRAATGTSQAAPTVPAPSSGVLALPAPGRDAMPLGKALEARATFRDFSPEPLSDQELSDLLWAANGYNRPEVRKRTAPTAINRQEIDLYVCRADGAYLWDSESNSLRLVCGEDLRGLTGNMRAGEGNFALAAPIALVFVVDYARQGLQDRPEAAAKYASVDCGFIGQNVYLHCAATGLHTVFLGSLRPEEISKALNLPATSIPLFAQTVGKPAAVHR